MAEDAMMAEKMQQYQMQQKGRNELCLWWWGEREDVPPSNVNDFSVVEVQVVNKGP